MRKCFSCKDTKNLKAIFIEDCDCHCDLPTSIFDEINHSICKGCFFSICSCDQDSHLAYECLDDENCENNPQMIKYNANWNDYDYHWNLKKTFKINK